MLQDKYNHAQINIFNDILLKFKGCLENLPGQM